MSVGPNFVLFRNPVDISYEAGKSSDNLGEYILIRRGISFVHSGRTNKYIPSDKVRKMKGSRILDSNNEMTILNIYAEDGLLLEFYKDKGDHSDKCENLELETRIF